MKHGVGADFPFENSLGISVCLRSDRVTDTRAWVNSLKQALG